MTVQEQLWQYFINKGFTPQSVAGIMGNVDEESKFQPNAVQKNNLYTNASYTNMVNTGIYNNFAYDGLGYGLVQWTYSVFKQDLYNRCRAANKSIADLNCQLDQMYAHLQSEGLLNQMKNFTSVKDATIFYMLKFEKPQDQSDDAQNKRIEAAQKWFNIFNKNKQQQQGGKKMKYSQLNPPLVCMMTNSTCYQSTNKMQVKGVLWHSTGANNKTIKRYVQPTEGDPKYAYLMNLIGKNTGANDWNHISIQAGLNAWIGTLADGSITSVQTMPWDYKPWGCGSGSKGSCNNGWIQFEICEDNLTDGTYFQKVYQEACELTAYLCKLYNINPLGNVLFNGIVVPTILCHQDSCQLGLGTNHSDVYHWFNKYGKTMDDVRKDIANLLEININANSPIINQNKNNISNMILKKGMKDDPQVQLLQEKLIELGYNLGKDGADGDFGQITELAVKTFQQKNGLTPNGIFGVETFSAMKKALEMKNSIVAPLINKEEIYRVRKAWNQPGTQIGAYKDLNNAKEVVDKLPAGYHVYDSNGSEIYPIVSSATTNNQTSNASIAINLPVAKTYSGVKLASSSKDENGRYTGGQRGDQTSREVYILDWYRSAWNYVLRPKTQRLAENIARAAEAGCANDNIGYSQGARNTLYIEAQKVGLDLSKITTPCDCDCSSFVSICCICAGLSPSIFYADGNMRTTYNMRQACEATGQFLVLSGNQYTGQKDYLKRGDILLNSNSHVTIVLSNGDQVEDLTSQFEIPIIQPTINNSNYTVQITVPFLNIRLNPNPDGKIVGQVKYNQVFTIVQEEGGYGKLKSGVGWIDLSYTRKMS